MTVWIKIDESLPPTETVVLGWIEEPDKPAMAFPAFAKLTAAGDWEIGDPSPAMQVTHWAWIASPQEMADAPTDAKALTAQAQALRMAAEHVVKTSPGDKDALDLAALMTNTEAIMRAGDELIAAMAQPIQVLDDQPFQVVNSRQDGQPDEFQTAPWAGDAYLDELQLDLETIFLAGHLDQLPFQILDSLRLHFGADGQDDTSMDLTIGQLSVLDAFAAFCQWNHDRVNVHPKTLAWALNAILMACLGQPTDLVHRAAWTMRMAAIQLVDKDLAAKVDDLGKQLAEATQVDDKLAMDMQLSGTLVFQKHYACQGQGCSACDQGWVWDWAVHDLGHGKGQGAD